VTEERVSIIIPTRDKLALLQRCIESLLALTTYRDFEIILVDTGSVEPRTRAYYETLKSHPQLQGRFKLVEYTGPFNYSRANNVGVAQASGSLLLFLNNDTEIIEPDWLEELARWAQRPDIGAVGAKLLYPSGHIQHAGVVIGMGGHAGHIFAGLEAHTATIFGSPDWYRDYLAVTGACLMTRRDVFERIGGFDEQYILVFSDVEYCLRVGAQGYKTVYTPFACLKHHESASRGSHIPVRDIQLGFEHMVAIVDRGDPCYNGNLATDTSVPALATNDAPRRAERLRQIVRQYEFYNRD
jgi:GT2 family glycosyltransferase